MKSRKIFWGLLFILIAILVLVNKLQFFAGIHLSTLILTVIFVYWLAWSIRYIRIWGILFSIAFLCILYSTQLHISAITPWPVLGAALFGSIGLSFIFPQHAGHRRYAYRNKTEGKQDPFAEHTDDEDISCTVSFTGTTKYIDSEKFRKAYLKCSFGSLKVFFDNTKVDGDYADIYIDTSFGETDIYLPKEWAVENQMTASFGDVKEFNKMTQTGPPNVTVRGNVSFGDCKIYYV